MSRLHARKGDGAKQAASCIRVWEPQVLVITSTSYSSDDARLPPADPGGRFDNAARRRESDDEDVLPLVELEGVRTARRLA